MPVTSFRPHRVPTGLWLLLAASAALFLVTWWPVLDGHRVLLGGDTLYRFPPWSGLPDARRPANVLVGDPVQQFLPWQELVARAFRSGRLPLWDPDALSGKPLLANDQSAPFSPFTWLALPFSPARGLSLAMLAKLWVAGLGLAVYLRASGTRGLSALVGGIAYASSSFMVVWLAWPQSAVASLLPWAFAAGEWVLSGGGLLATAALAVAVGLQFLGGHAETSLHLGVGLGLYVAARWLTGPRSLSTLFGLVAGAVLGTLLAGVQLLPFLAELPHTTVALDRARLQVGGSHLDPSTLWSWLVPNLHGNPALDGRPGWSPNYNEAVGYAGVTALCLAPLGLVDQARRQGSRALALVLPGLVAAGVVYGPLSGLAARVPGLALANNSRMLVLLCFLVAALAGFGVDLLLRSARPRWRGPAGPGLALAGLAVLALAAGAGLIAVHGGTWADHPGLLPRLPHGLLAFWILMSGLALVGALAAILAGLGGGAGRPAALAVGVLALIEGWVFSFHYQPLVSPHEVPPATAVTTWLREHGGPVAGIDVTLVPDTATLYGLRDVRTYDIAFDVRSRLFWSAADPRYQDRLTGTLLETPGVGWLRLAGVRYVVGPGVVPGTVPELRAEGVTVAAVPDPRPLAWAAPTWVAASGSGPDRATLLHLGPEGPPVLEGAEAQRSSLPAGRVTVLSERAGELRLDARLPGREAVVVLQSYAPGWQAEVDGRPAAVHPADVKFMAVVVPAGDHLVTLSYRPGSVAWGTRASLAGLALILLLVAAVGRRLRPKGSWIRLGS
ncbi:MAG TPA: YfhO family protein [Candidatus Dormibacteraeota bacterium]|nr:YfhO family protein [Candidatus Dormibacteraeota bacterium]